MRPRRRRSDLEKAAAITVLVSWRPRADLKGRTNLVGRVLLPRRDGCLANARVSTAAADVAAHRGVDRGVGGFRSRREQRAEDISCTAGSVAACGSRADHAFEEDGVPFGEDLDRDDRGVTASALHLPASAARRGGARCTRERRTPQSVLRAVKMHLVAKHPSRAYAGTRRGGLPCTFSGIHGKGHSKGQDRRPKRLRRVSQHGLWAFVDYCSLSDVCSQAGWSKGQRPGFLAWRARFT